MKSVVICLLVVAAQVFAGEDDYEPDFLQKPIGLEGRAVVREIGDRCQYSSDCISGCCLLNRKEQTRECSPKAKKGEPCGSSQIKFDVYIDHCPCEAGDAHCSNSLFRTCRN